MLTITRRTRENVTIIDLEGEIDGSESSQRILDSVKQSLEQKPGTLLLNLRSVHWINSLGVGYIVAAFVSARNQGATLRLFGVTSRVTAVLKACGVSPTIIGIFANEEAALEAAE